MNFFALINLVAPLIPMVIELVEQTVPGPKKGRAKRRRAIAAIKQIAGAVPLAAKQVKEIGTMVDNAVAEMNAKNKGIAPADPPPL